MGTPDGACKIKIMSEVFILLSPPRGGGKGGEEVVPILEPELRFHRFWGEGFQGVERTHGRTEVCGQTWLEGHNPIDCPRASSLKTHILFAQGSLFFNV
jgi:hypothetical protein